MSTGMNSAVSANQEEPWVKDGDLTYLSDAMDPAIVRSWPYRTYACSFRVAPPKATQDNMKKFQNDFPRVMAERTGRKTSDFRVVTAVNPFHPEDWEDEEDPLYVQLTIEGDLRHIDIKEWVRKAKKTIFELNGMTEGMIMVFFLALHNRTKSAPL